MPGESGGPVVTNSCVCFHHTRGCGCIGHPAFPTPSFGRALHAPLGRIAPRDRGLSSEIGSDVIARSEATKQSILSLCGKMDCFAEPVIGRRLAPTRWLAMTVCLGCLKIESSCVVPAKAARKRGPITPGGHWGGAVLQQGY